MNAPEALPIHKIMLAIDGSEHALAAADFTRSLPMTAGTKVTIVAVLIPREASSKSWALMDALDRTRTLLQDRCGVETIMLTGSPAEELITFAGRLRPELIVLGAKGLRSTVGILLGGVAQQIVEYVCCPVLVFRAPFSGLRRVAFCLDESECSHEALGFLLRFPFKDKIDLRVLHVLPPVDVSDLVVNSWLGRADVLAPSTAVDLEERFSQQAAAEKEAGQAMVAQAVARLQERYPRTTPVLLRGDAATEIIKYGKDEDIDLLMAGSRGLSRLESWFLGSVSRKLVHYAGRSVLIVKTPPADTEV